MSVEDRMKFMPRTVAASDSVAHARALLDEYHIRHLPVLARGKLIGMVTDGDLYSGGSARNRPGVDRALAAHPDRVRVQTVMMKDAPSVRPSDTLKRAAVLMARARIGALPVVEQGHLRGIISDVDIVSRPSAGGVQARPKAGNNQSVTRSRTRLKPLEAGPRPFAKSKQSGV